MLSFVKGICSFSLPGEFTFTILLLYTNKQSTSVLLVAAFYSYHSSNSEFPINCSAFDRCGLAAFIDSWVFLDSWVAVQNLMVILTTRSFWISALCFNSSESTFQYISHEGLRWELTLRLYFLSDLLFLYMSILPLPEGGYNIRLKAYCPKSKRTQGGQKGFESFRHVSLDSVLVFWLFSLQILEFSRIDFEFSID